MTELPITPLKRIIKSNGATRTNDAAAIELANILEDYAEEVALRAIKLAKHAGRKTITADDIKLAAGY